MGFSDNPIICSPFEPPSWFFELDREGQPTGAKLAGRRESIQITPVAASRRRSSQQGTLALDDVSGESTVTRNTLANEIRTYVDQWRSLPPSQWGVTPETQRLLLHWRDPYRSRKLFFCQREAVETLIYLTEVAPTRFRKTTEAANAEANPGLYRLASKMATGSCKTTVMAMIIAWQAVNKARRPNAKGFSDAFLIVSPGITIRDRLRMLLPQDAENVYEALNLAPTDLMDGVRKARIVVTNYQKLNPQETFEGNKLTASIVFGREAFGDGKKIRPETDGQMIARVASGLMGRKNIVVLNDEAHHCYRHKIGNENENGETQRYRPDYIVTVDDGQPEPLNLLVEIKSLRRDSDAAKPDTMQKIWIPAVNNAKAFGRWDFLEFKDIPYGAEERIRAFVRTRTAA